MMHEIYVRIRPSFKDGIQSLPLNVSVSSQSLAYSKSMTKLMLSENPLAKDCLKILGETIDQLDDQPHLRDANFSYNGTLFSVLYVTHR